MTKRVVIELDDDVHELLMKLSKRACLSPSGLIRDLVNITYERTWRRTPNPPPPRPPDELARARARKSLRDHGLMPPKPRKPTKR